MGFLFFEKNRMICLLCGVGCLLMMLFPEITVDASKAAIRIWMNAVVPSLLPFMIIAGYIKRTSATNIAGHGLYPVFMAFLSGYPMGAKLAGEQYRDGRLNARGLQKLLCYAMITGPAFLVGGVGMTFYGTKTAGYILACSHYAGAVTCGLLLDRGGSLTAGNAKGQKKNPAIPSETPFTDCILESFRTLGIVLAYIVLFMIGTEFLESGGTFTFLPEAMKGFCKGLLEMTVGCSEIAEASLSIKEKLLLTSFVISFGGLSDVRTICFFASYKVLNVWKNSSCVESFPPIN